MCRTIVEVSLTNELEHETTLPTTASSPRWTPFVSPRRFCGIRSLVPRRSYGSSPAPKTDQPSRLTSGSSTPSCPRARSATSTPGTQDAVAAFGGVHLSLHGGELRRCPRNSGACSIESLFQSIEHRTNFTSIALPPTAPRSKGSLLLTSPQTSLAGTAGSSTRRRIVEFDKTEPPMNSYLEKASALP